MAIISGVYPKKIVTVWLGLTPLEINLLTSRPEPPAAARYNKFPYTVFLMLYFAQLFSKDRLALITTQDKI